MAKQTKITNLTQGDHWFIERPTSLIPLEGINSAFLYIKDRHDTPDGEAIITKEITTSYVAGVGVILDNGAGDGAGELRFELVPAETDLLVSGRSYALKVVVFTPSGIRNTPEKGTLIPM